VIRTLILLLALALPAGAQTLPALYAVTGVAEGDTLNIRATPDGSGQKLGTLPRDAQDVEVVGLSDNGRWGQVNTGEASGWVAMRYLARQPGPDWTALQSPLTCGGTEPFWSARYDPARRDVTFDLMGEGARTLGVLWSAAASGRVGVIGFSLAEGGFAVLKGAACSDGMSDRSMGLALDLYLGDGPGGAGYSGCCRLAP
jgi:uncharacterized membrane protein